MSSVIFGQEEAKYSREKSDAVLLKLTDQMASLTRDIAEVKTQMTLNAPVIEEVITIKHKVAGAGLFGKWVWAAAAAIISMAAAVFALKTEIAKAMQGS